MPPLSTSTTSHEFRRFPELPVEIRLKIWKHAIAHPRVIRVRVSGPERARADHSWLSYNPPPSLSVCTESREVAYPTYSNLKPIGFRRERDILRFVGWEKLRMFALHELCARPHEIDSFVHDTCSKEAQGAFWSFEKQEKRKEKQEKKRPTKTGSGRSKRRARLTQERRRIIKKISTERNTISKSVEQLIRGINY